jgi:hypothetical protein
VKLYFDTKNIRLVRDKKDVVLIPVSAVTEISYGQDVHRRIGAAIGVGVVTLGVGALLGRCERIRVNDSRRDLFSGIRSKRIAT